jgi:predicted dehydrogenase
LTRVGIVGLGEAGISIHLPALRAMDGVVVVGAADASEQQRQRVAARERVPVFTSTRELMTEAKPQLVIVATPPAVHAEHCITALEGGADVLCEKPLAASVQQARAVAERAVAVGRSLYVNHEFRAMPVFRAVIDAVRADAAGPVVVQVWQLIDHNPAAERGWRGQLRRRGLYEAGVHLVDLALQLFAEVPRRVSATFAAAGAARAAGDSLSLVTLEFSRGRLAQLVQCRRHRGDRQYMEVRADLADASYRASFGGRARLTLGLLRSPRPHLSIERGGSGIAWREQGPNRRLIARNGSAPLVQASRDVIAACIAGAGRGPALSFPASDGIDALRVVAAAYLSAALGRAVDPDGPDRDTIERLPLAETLST